MALAVVNRGWLRRHQRSDQTLHDLHRTSDQDVVLMGALSNAEKQLIVFVDEGLDERPVFRRQDLGQRGERGLSWRQQILRQAALTAFPLLSGLLDRGAMGVNGGGRGQ